MDTVLIFLIKVFAASLSPVKILIILPIVIWMLKSGKNLLLIVGTTSVLAALCSEMILTQSQGMRQFGDGIVIQFVASFILSILCLGVAEKFFVKDKGN